MGHQSDAESDKVELVIIGFLKIMPKLAGIMILAGQRRHFLDVHRLLGEPGRGFVPLKFTACFIVTGITTPLQFQGNPPF